MRDLAGGKLAEAEEQADGELADAVCPEAAWPRQKSSPMLSCPMAMRPIETCPIAMISAGDPADRDDSVGSDSLARLGADAVCVMDER